jgi:hypothetical protein
MDKRAISLISIGFGIIIFLIMMTTVTWDVQVVEKYTRYEPYTYSQSLIRTNQVHAGFLWLKEVTQAQYIVTNSEPQKGSFSLNFVFDNSSTTKTVTKNIDILAGERKAVTVNSPLSGVSTVNLQVTPPSKAIPSERTVTKKVNGWDYIGHFIFHIKL